ncbi:MAG: hypothetical protein NTV49_05565 [Kiritimatiellaeota bacterium]|nr:hypothetical protein [Kiritimatiellota bacterium]
MGLNNWMVQKALRSEAKRIANWAAKTYPVVRAQHQGVPEQQVHQRMIRINPSGLSEEARHRLDVCSQTIEGLCYLVADMEGSMKGWAAFRCLQLTTHIDAALYARGFKRQTKEMKERILAALDLPTDNWEAWAGEA